MPEVPANDSRPATPSKDGGPMMGDTAERSGLVQTVEFVGGLDQMPGKLAHLRRGHRVSVLNM
jgi:hypothetical protein